MEIITFYNTVRHIIYLLQLDSINCSNRAMDSCRLTLVCVCDCVCIWFNIGKRHKNYRSAQYFCLHSHAHLFGGNASFGLNRRVALRAKIGKCEWMQKVLHLQTLIILHAITIGRCYTLYPSNMNPFHYIHITWNGIICQFQFVFIFAAHFFSLHSTFFSHLTSSLWSLRAKNKTIPSNENNN